jgi:hypothetical protein
MSTNAITISGADRSDFPESGPPTIAADAPQPIVPQDELKLQQPVEEAGAAKFNRRSIMNMMVTTAIVGTALATKAEGSAQSPDAEIIAAGKAFEPLLTEYLDVRFVWMRLAREGRAEMEAAFPDADDNFKGKIGHHPKWDFHRQVLDRNGCRAADDRMSAISKEMEPVADIIRDAEITTIEGLRAKTLVAIWECQPVCASHDGHFDFDNPENHWSLFTAAVALTGLSAMVSTLDERLQADATVFYDEDEDGESGGISPEELAHLDRLDEVRYGQS